MSPRTWLRICVSTSASRAESVAGERGIGSSAAGAAGEKVARSSSRMRTIASVWSAAMEGQQKVGRGPTMVTMEVAADGGWALRGGCPHRTMNVYFIEEPSGGVTLVDAGIQTMTRHVVNVGRIMGG